jgi:hypothetical protein
LCPNPTSLQQVQAFHAENLPHADLLYLSLVAAVESSLLLLTHVIASGHHCNPECSPHLRIHALNPICEVPALAWDAITKYCRLGGLETPEIHFLWLWTLGYTSFSVQGGVIF